MRKLHCLLHPAPVIFTALILQPDYYIALTYIMMWCMGWQHAWCVMQPIVSSWRIVDNYLSSVCSRKGLITCNSAALRLCSFYGLVGPKWWWPVGKVVFCMDIALAPLAHTLWPIPAGDSVLHHAVLSFTLLVVLMGKAGQAQ